jgi:hypothetical protein
VLGLPLKFQGQHATGLLAGVAPENIHDFGNKGREVHDFFIINM